MWLLWVVLGVRETKKNIYDEKVGFASKSCVARGSSFFMKFGGGVFVFSRVNLLRGCRAGGGRGAGGVQNVTGGLI